MGALVPALLLVCCSLLATVPCSNSLSQLASPPLSVAAFNVRILGVTKISSKQVLDALVKIIRRYDIILIQEIRDSSNKVIPTILSEVNSVTELYNVTNSERLGRGSHKEMYAFFYRTDTVELLDTYQYPDVDDVFERPPYAVRVRAKLSDLEEFAILGLHASPHDVMNELEGVPDSIEEIQTIWSTQNILLTGDLNAGCKYLNPLELRNLSLASDPDYHWWIDDSVDTTVTHTYCPYDRFVSMGPEFQAAVVYGSVKIFPFDEQYLMTADEALAVSDHYPVELQLRGKPNATIQRNLIPSVSYTVEDKRAAKSSTPLRRIYLTEDPSPFTVERLMINTRITYVSATLANLTDPRDGLAKFRALFPDVVSDEAASMVVAMHEASVLQSAVPVYGMIGQRPPALFTLTVFCTFKSENMCKISVEGRLNG